MQGMQGWGFRCCCCRSCCAGAQGRKQCRSRRLISYCCPGFGGQCEASNALNPEQCSIWAAIGRADAGAPEDLKGLGPFASRELLVLLARLRGFVLDMGCVGINHGACSSKLVAACT